MTRFIKGYKIISGMENKPRIIALILNCININNEKNNNKIKKIIASKIDTLFVTNGLLDVRLTFLSRLMSIMSLIIQPELRIKKDPITKKIYHCKCSIGLIGVIAKANQHGHIRSVKPIGLLKRISSNKDLTLLGMILSGIV